MSSPLRCRRLLASLFGALALLALFSITASPVRADDGIFPSAPAAKPFIDFDGRGFLINGKRTFIASGGLEYARIPRELWRDRLLRLKRGGFNCVEIYCFWNFHEPQEGKWNFKGNADLDAFLKLVKEMGLYAVVRPGPYVCAEWESGGYPVWLRFKPGLRVREDNPAFLAAVDRYYEKVLSIIAANQIHRGGSVVMVQLENEHPQGWGKDMPNAYFRHLRDKAVSLGIEVPYFFSGLHHGNDPAGGRPWDSKNRTNPWFTTEFWPGWYDLYGPLNPSNFRKFDRGTWKIIAYGGNGYNFYMLHGGTNFGYTNNDEDASSYDYGGAIGQAGDLRPIYYHFKRAALFARSFASVLEDSENATDAYRDSAVTASGPTVAMTARKSPAGTLLFLDNNGSEPAKAQVKEADGTSFPAAGPFTLAPGEIVPIVRDYHLLPGVTLERATRLFGIFPQSGVTTIVAYGPPGDPIELRFRATGNRNSVPPSRVTMTAPPLDATKPGQATLMVGTQRLRVLAMNDRMVDRTWFLDEKNGQGSLVVGPDYVGEPVATKGGTRFRIESPWKASDPVSGYIYGPEGTVAALNIPAPGNYVMLSPIHTRWQTRPADTEATPTYKGADSDRWTKSGAQPVQMGADGEVSPYAWYRATIHAPKAGTYRLRVSGGDWMSVFVNGLPVAKTDIRRGFNKPATRLVTLNLPAGNSTLAVLTAHYGRSKVFNYLGQLDTVDIKGLTGEPTLVSETGGGTVPVTGWQYKMDGRGEGAADEYAAPTLNETAAAGWTPAPTGQNRDVFQRRRGFAWYRVTLPAISGGAGMRRLRFAGVDDNATIYLNGKKILRHEGWDDPFEVPLTDGWRADGPNVVAVLVENTDNTGGLYGDVEMESYTPADGAEITDWRMRGGLTETKATDLWDDPTPRDGWQTISDASRAPGIPTFYRTTFTSPGYESTGAHPIWRVSVKGLSRGFVWLNGHNLGRYPERVPVEGIYLPECWLKPDNNTLVIFDEEGASPAQVQLVREEAASRQIMEASVSNGG